MSYDEYDIKIWHQSIRPILVSKEAYGHQQSHLLMQILLNKLFQNKKLKTHQKGFSFVNFENIFSFLFKVKIAKEKSILETYVFLLNVLKIQFYMEIHLEQNSKNS
jgi:hypothetical protein